MEGRLAVRRFVEFYFFVVEFGRDFHPVAEAAASFLQSHNVIPSYASRGLERDVFAFSSDANSVGENAGKP